MSILYIDTSHHLTLGVLSKDFQWLSFLSLEEKKTSAFLHPMLLKVFEDAQLTQSDIKRVIQMSGPGSYTGMRLSHGVLQVFDWYGVPVNGIYHFEVPRLQGIKQGSWIAKAYKKEFFIYSWDEGNDQYELISELDFIASFREKNHEEREKFYSHFPEALSEELTIFHSTHLMMRNNPREIFQKVIELNLKRGPYYYRSLNEEFNRPKI